MGNIIQIEKDITIVKVDAIVNAANSSLLGGGGVDGAIHRAAGPDLLKECMGLGGCPTGEARITKAYNLPCRLVIHTVGPIWQGGDVGEMSLLASCYRQCFMLAKQYSIKTMAIPAVSTGVYCFPKELAAQIAIQETRKALRENHTLKEVLFTCFNTETTNAYKKYLSH